MKIVFMGTPDFASAALEAVLDAGHEVAAVVTQPDKPKGRGKAVQMSPVKECALRHGIPVLQPVKIKEKEAVDELAAFQADLYVVAAFGQILSQEILDQPRFGCVNIHASLLPRYRGAAPIQWAILDGEKETGVTIMQMDRGLDTGDMLLKSRVAIDDRETAASLHDKLSLAGAELIVEALERIERQELIPEPQDDAEACYASMLKKSMGDINWSRTAEEIDRLVRGLNSWPSAYTYYQNKTMKIWECDPVYQYEAKEKRAGSIVKVEKDAFYVQTGQGLLKITEIQLEGKKRMSVKEFLLGCPLKEGVLLGKEGEK